MFKLKLPHLLTLARSSYLALLTWVILWHSYLAPSPTISLFFLLGLWVTPLLLPLIGIIKGKAYTYAWASFILLLYVLHGATILVVSPAERWLAVVELLLVFAAFLFGSYYARLKSQSLKQST